MRKKQGCFQSVHAGHDPAFVACEPVGKTVTTWIAWVLYCICSLQTGPAIRQDVINGMWALSVSDHPGSANTRAYLARALKAWDESGWQDLHVLSARQITQYLTVRC